MNEKLSSCSSDFDLLLPIDSYGVCNKLTGKKYCYILMKFFCVSLGFQKKYYVNKVDSFYWTQIKLSAHTLVGLFLRKCFGEKLDTVIQKLLDLFQLMFLR